MRARLKIKRVTRNGYTFWEAWQYPCKLYQTGESECMRAFIAGFRSALSPVALQLDYDAELAWVLARWRADGAR